MLMPKISPTLCKLLSWHIFIIVLSNYAVQIPMNCFGITSTWGTFTYPFIFITTDLTVRIYGPHLARKVIFAAMIPALIASYFVGTLFAQGQYQGSWFPYWFQSVRLQNFCCVIQRLCNRTNCWYFSLFKITSSKAMVACSCLLFSCRKRTWYLRLFLSCFLSVSWSFYGSKLGRYRYLWLHGKNSVQCHIIRTAVRTYPFISCKICFQTPFNRNRRLILIK